MLAVGLEDRAKAGGGLYADIGAMLESNGLEPTPAHFELCHRYFTSGDADLRGAMDTAIRRYGGISPAMAISIASQRRGEFSAAELDRMADDAQRRLAAITAIADSSGKDARDYGDALARNVADAQTPDSLVALMDLTRAMIDRTRTASHSLHRHAEEVSALRHSLAEARKTAETDPLTGLPNRRALDTRLRLACDAARDSGAPLSVAICDIDMFKAVNDRHGHQMGDEVLKFFATALSSEASDTVYVARYGGEEFVMLFEGVVPADAMARIDRIRTAISARDFRIRETGTELGRLSFSAGVAGLEGRKGSAATLRQADAALYRAKQTGRNRVCLS